jgi:hypothetical protein
MSGFKSGVDTDDQITSGAPSTRMKASVTLILLSAVLERRLSSRIDGNVVHSAEHLKERARFIDDHRVDMEPISVTGRGLDVVGGLRGEQESGTISGQDRVRKRSARHEFTVADGSYVEGPRKALAIMLKDKTKYAATGSWGFQAWAGGDSTKPMVTDATKQCFECHQSRNDQDYVYSTYIPLIGESS